MRSAQRTPRFVAFLATILLLLAQPSAARAQSLDSLKKDEAAAKRAADKAAARLTESMGRLHELEHEIAETKARIAAKQQRADELGTLAVNRAVEAYKGASMPVADVLESPDLLEASRKARLLGQVTRQDSETIDRLAVEATDLQTEQERLDALEAEQERVVAANRSSVAEWEKRAAQLENKRKALEVRLASQSRARSVRTSRGGAAAPAPVNGLVCPFPGSSFVDSWGAPRSGGRRHKGTDMMGGYGGTLYAVTSGSVSQRAGGLAGKAVWLHGDDGNLYFYAHLSDYGAGGRVNRGDVVGYNGATGNASGGAPHLHFEIKLGGSTSVNPYPTVRSIC